MEETFNTLERQTWQDINMEEVELEPNKADKWKSPCVEKRAKLLVFFSNYLPMTFCKDDLTELCITLENLLIWFAQRITFLAKINRSKYPIAPKKKIK